jgi:hypothetical protein
MWTCPECHRQFKNRIQDHSCGQFTIERVFENKPGEIFALFQQLSDTVKTFGEMQVRAVKNGVMFSVKSTFLALKPHQRYLAVEFTGGIAHDEFPVEKCIKISKNEFAHILRIELNEEIDEQLIGWLKEAYRYNCRKI